MGSKLTASGFVDRAGAVSDIAVDSSTEEFAGACCSPLDVLGLSEVSCKIATSTTDFSIVSAIRGTGSIDFGALGYYRTTASNDRFFVGDVAELLIYDDILTTTERESVESYLTDKWASQAVPEPASFILIGLAGFCVMAVRRRRSRS